jgi:hypothetical protein
MSQNDIPHNLIQTRQSLPVSANLGLGIDQGQARLRVMFTA